MRAGWNRNIHYHDVERIVAPIRDPSETLADVQSAVDRTMPGDDFTRRLLFRYSLVWQKPRV